MMMSQRDSLMAQHRPSTGSHAIIVSPFQRRKYLSETLERPLSAENRVFYEHPTQMSHHTIKVS